MNRTLKEATVRRYHSDNHAQLRAHLQLFLEADNYARRLKALRGLTPDEFICKTWTDQPHRFRVNPTSGSIRHTSPRDQTSKQVCTACPTNAVRPAYADLSRAKPTICGAARGTLLRPARHKTVAKAVLIAAIPPLMLKTGANSDGMTIEAFDQIRANVLAARSQSWKNLGIPFYGYTGQAPRFWREYVSSACCNA